MVQHAHPRIVIWRTLIVLFLVLGLAGCGLVQVEQTAAARASMNVVHAAGNTPTPVPTPGGNSQVGSSSATMGDFRTVVRQVAQEVRPAVVQITNQQVQIDQFNQPFDVPAGVGSGVIYDREGHILTNNHVIEGAQKLLVTLPDGRSFEGKLIGRDPRTDLAVVQIKGDDLPVAELGDSKALQVGDWVVAIGNALALPGGPTVTVGVVSAVGRTVQEPGSSTGGAGPYLFDTIQTDAPINPGNSGGALVDLNGKVVGINTLVAGQAEPGIQAQGIGFAISIATAKPIADQLVATGKVVHAYLGIVYLPLSPAIAAPLRIQQQEGVILRQVTPGAAAAEAGLQASDVITEVDGKALKGESDFAQAIDSHKPGDLVTLTVWRNGDKLSVKVKLGEMPTP